MFLKYLALKVEPGLRGKRTRMGCNSESKNSKFKLSFPSHWGSMKFKAEVCSLNGELES